MVEGELDAQACGVVSEVLHEVTSTTCDGSFFSSLFENSPSPFIARGEKPCYMVPRSNQMDQSFVLSSCFSSMILAFDGKSLC